MTDIKKGDWVKIPKDTLLAGTSFDYRGQPVTPSRTGRDVVVQVKDVRGDWWEHELTAAEQRSKQNVQWSGSPPARQAEYDRLKDAVCKRLGISEATTLAWGSEYKQTYVDFVTKVDAPAKSTKPTKINKKQQMVPGSRWKVTKDTDLAIDVPNPAVESSMNAWDRAHRGGGWATHTPAGRAAYDAHFKARDAERDRLNATLGEFTSRPIRSLKAGEVFEVTSKWSTYCPYNYSVRGESWVDVQFDDTTKALAIPYKSVEPVIEVESIPTVDVFVIRQKSTGLFYKAYDWTAYHDNGDHKVEYADTFMKAKQYDGLSRAKASVLELSGYYNGLPGSENLPEWMGHGKVVTFTDDYEFVKFDKLRRQEVEAIDLWAWFERAWELRKLTVVFGSSVRTVYNDLDERGELEEQKGLLVFKAPDDQDQDWRTRNDKSVFTPEQQKSVDDLVSALNLKRGSFRKAQDFRSFSMSFKDKGAAMIAKLTYGGTLKMHVLDLESLKEVAEG